MKRVTRIHNSAFALVIVLWIMVILVTAGVVFSRMVRLEVRMAGNSLKAAKAGYIAKAGIIRTAVKLSEDSNFLNDLLKTEREPGKEDLEEKYLKDVTVGEGTYSIVLEDEQAKINVRSIGEDKQAMLEALPGLDADIVASILDWIDPDDLVKMLGGTGAEREYYLSLDPPYECKNGPLDTPEELLLVKGINTNSSLYWGEDINGNGMLDDNEDDGDANFPPDNADGVLDKGIREYVTSFTDNRVNLNTADAVVLAALLDGDTLRAEEIIALREVQGGTFSSVSAVDEILGDESRRIKRYLTTTSFCYRIKSTGSLAGSGVKRTVEAVVKINEGGDGGPFKFVYWREY